MTAVFTCLGCRSSSCERICGYCVLAMICADNRWCTMQSYWIIHRPSSKNMLPCSYLLDTFKHMHCLQFVSLKIIVVARLRFGYAPSVPAIKRLQSLSRFLGNPRVTSVVYMQGVGTRIFTYQCRPGNMAPPSHISRVFLSAIIATAHSAASKPHNHSDAHGGSSNLLSTPTWTVAATGAGGCEARPSDETPPLKQVALY